METAGFKLPPPGTTATKSLFVNHLYRIQQSNTLKRCSLCANNVHKDARSALVQIIYAPQPKTWNRVEEKLCDNSAVLSVPPAINYTVS